MDFPYFTKVKGKISPVFPGNRAVVAENLFHDCMGLISSMTQIPEPEITECISQQDHHCLWISPNGLMKITDTYHRAISLITVSCQWKENINTRIAIDPEK